MRIVGGRGFGPTEEKMRAKNQEELLEAFELLIGIGAAVTRRPLPHHRAYGSVHGDSSRLR